MTDFLSVPLPSMIPATGVRERVAWETAIPAMSDILAWFSARAAYVTKDGSNNVTVMDDRTNTRDMIVIPTSGTTKSPTFVDAADAVGLPVIRFNGSNDVLQWGNPGYLPTTGDFTKVVIFKTNGTPSAPGHLFSRSNSQANSLFVNGTTISGQVGTSPNDAIATATYRPSEWQIVVHSFDYSAGTSKIAVNGGTVGSTTKSGANTTQPICYMGGSTSTPANPFNGDIAEVLVFSADLLDASRAADYASLLQFARDVRGVVL